MAFRVYLKGKKQIDDAAYKNKAAAGGAQIPNA